MDVQQRNSPHQIQCPTCHQVGHWFDGDYGPFCSRRCRLIDLGKWLGGENRISQPLRPEHFAEYEHLPPSEKLDDPQQ